MAFANRRLRAPLIAAVLLLVSVPAGAQTSSAYFEFLMARRLEALGDNSGALAALERAAAADPASAEVRAEIASFQLRRDRRSEAESAALEALKLNDNNIEAHRVLGLLYAASADALNTAASSPRFQATAREAIRHLERAATEITAGIEVLFSLGRLYLRMDEAAKAVEAFGRVVTQNPDPGAELEAGMTCVLTLSRSGPSVAPQPEGR